MVRKCTSINKIPGKGMCSTCAIIFRSIEILHHHFRNSHHQSLYFIHPHCTYILWSKIIFGLKFIFLYFRIWQCMIMSQWRVWKKKETKIEKKKKERNFEPRIKLSHNIYIPGINVSPLLYKRLNFKLAIFRLWALCPCLWVNVCPRLSLFGYKPLSLISKGSYA